MSHSTIDYKNTNRTVAAVFIGLVVIIAGLIDMSRPGSFASSNSLNSQSNSKSLLAAGETFFDFGTISMAKGKVSKSFPITNPTANAIIAKKLYTSCMCTKASLTQGDIRVGPFGMPSHGGIVPISVEIAPGAEAIVEAVFDPAAHGPAGVGPISRDVYLETSDGGKLTLGFKANVIP